MDGVIVKLVGEPGLAGALVTSVQRRNTISAAIAQRLTEMYDRGASERTILRLPDPCRIDLAPPDDEHEERGYARLSAETRPIVAGVCLRVIRQSVENAWRRHAPEAIRRMGDASLLPELEEIARGPDAEGIEKELAETIEFLRQKGEEQK